MWGIGSLLGYKMATSPFREALGTGRDSLHLPPGTVSQDGPGEGSVPQPPPPQCPSAPFPYTLDALTDVLGQCLPARPSLEERSHNRVQTRGSPPLS